jgi:hypothetical protein
LLDASKYVPWMLCRECGEASVIAVCFQKPISLVLLSARAELPANTLSKNAYNRKQAINQLALGIQIEMMQMPPQWAMGAPVFGGADVTKFIAE